MRRLLTAALGLLTMSLPACTAVAPVPPWRTALDAELDALAADAEHPLLALSALAIRDGHVVYEHQAGHARVDPADPARGHPVTGRTLFRVASISKLVVALGVMRLVEQGRLDLDADAGEQLGWPLRNPQHPQRPISLRLLLSHRSSLTDGDPPVYGWGADVSLRDVLSPEGRLYREGAHWRRDKAPGEWFEYVNLNWGVVATVMERATGERFDRLMQRLVLAPLGLRGGFDPAAFDAADVADIATLYRKRSERDGREVWDPRGPWVAQADDFARTPPSSPADLERYVVGSNGTLFGPQGRLRISVADLGTVMRMLLDGGRHAGQAFLQPQTVRRLASEQWRFDARRPNGQSWRDGAQSWGLGVQRFVDVSAPGRGDRLVDGGGFTGYGHLGDAYGLMGVFALDPARRRGVVLVASGPGVDPATFPSRWSALYRWQELALSALWRHALAGGAGHPAALGGAGRASEAIGTGPALRGVAAGAAQR